MHPGLVVIAVLIFAPLVLTYTFTLIKSAVFHGTGKATAEPHSVPYLIPWLGNFPSFMFNSKRYQLALQKTFGHVPVRLAMMDRLLYFVPHGETMQALFRDSRHTVPAPCLLSALVLFFGLPQEDAVLFKKQNLQKPNPAHSSGTRGTDPSRHVMELHRDDFKVYLQSQNLGRIMSKIDAIFSESISSDPSITTGEWTEFPDLHAFMATRMFEAVTRTIFGDGFLDVCPDLYGDFWAFYEALPTLLLKVPRWMNPKIWAARDKMHEDFIRWRRWGGEQPGQRTSPENTDVFDPTWGTSMSRRLSDIYKDIGFSETGVAAAMLSYISVVFANTIPSTLWTMLHILQSENVTNRVLAEMKSSFEPSSIHFNLSELCSGPLLNSVYRETLRLRQLGPVARVPRRPNYLLSGKWSILPRTPILAVSWLAGRDETFWNTGAVLPNGQQEHPIEAFWAERFLTYPDDVASGPIRKPNTYVTIDTASVRSKERSSEEDKTARLSVAGLQGHFFPFGGGAYRCPGENFARQLTMSTVALMLRMLDIELVDPVAARSVQSHYAQYPLGDHRFDRKVPIRVRRKLFTA